MQTAFVHTRIMQKAVSLGSEIFKKSYTEKHFYYILTNRKKQIVFFIWCLLEALINDNVKRTSGLIFLSRNHVLEP